MKSSSAAEAPDTLNRALGLVRKDMDRFSRVLVQSLDPQRPYLTETEMEIYQSGKKIRPLILILCARMVFRGAAEEPLPEKVIHAAVSTEMLHVATLIHDDIIDRAPQRRGLPSVHRERGTDIAILIGDMQFVQAIRCFTGSINVASDMHLVRLVLNTAFKICCGEIDELQTDPQWDTPQLRGRYYQTIERKTAVLFGLAAECGVALGGGRTHEARLIGFFGRRLGRTFQMMDDLFDVARPLAEAGKSQGTDLLRRRASLPAIYAMEELGPDHLVSRVMRGAASTVDEFQAALLAIRRSNGFIRVYQEAREQALDGLQYLHSFPANAYRTALEELAFYIIDRPYK
jgi:heptaprenyl diphosphate synthase